MDYLVELIKTKILEIRGNFYDEYSQRLADIIKNPNLLVAIVRKYNREYNKIVKENPTLGLKEDGFIFIIKPEILELTESLPDNIKKLHLNALKFL